MIPRQVGPAGQRPSPQALTDPCNKARRLVRRAHAFCSPNGVSTDLPTVVADANTNAHAGSPKSDAGTRTIIPVTIAAAFDVTLARHVIIGIPNDHAAPATAAIASVLITDHANRLQQIRPRVFAARVDVGSICAANKQRAGAGQQRDGEFAHEFLLIGANSALLLKPCRPFRSRRILASARSELRWNSGCPSR